MMKNTSARRGFTLIEILVVIGLIAILAAIVLIAINPARQFAQARNSQRESNVNTILNGIGQRMADNKGKFGGGACPDFGTGFSTTSVDFGSGGAGKDLSCLTPTYIPAFPKDPSYSGGVDTLYKIAVDSTGRVSICAPNYIETGTLNLSNEYCLTR